MSARDELIKSIQQSLTPWSQRSGGDWWSGMTEQQALDHAQRVHEMVQQGGMDSEAIDGIMQRAFPSMNQSERRNFASWTGPRSKIESYGVPHTAGSEGVFANLMSQSGNPTISWPKHIGSHDATDFGTRFGDGDKTTLIDHQNIVTEGRYKDNPMLSLPAVGNIDSRGGYDFAENVFDQADGDRTLGSIIQETKDQASQVGRTSDGKLLQSTTSRINPEGTRDGHMSRTPGKYKKSYLIGGVFDRDNITNLTGDTFHGSYDPKMPTAGYAVDLESLRENMVDMTKDQFTSSENRGSIVRGQKPGRNSKLTFRMPKSFVDKFGRGQEAFDELISPEVWSEATRFADSNEFRSALGSVDNAQSITKGLWKGRLGGLGNAALGGASREAGKKLGQGDIAGAATEFGVNYGIGAAVDVGLRKAGEQIVKRIPAAAARFGAGTAGSGGFAAPMMAAWTAYDLADGITEGVTGKGITKRIEEKTDDAVMSAYERKWGTPAPKGGFVPKPTPTPEPVREHTPMTASQLTSLKKATAGMPEPTVNQISAPAPQPSPEPQRKFGQRAVLNGHDVRWGGDDYGWQRLSSFKTLK